MVKKHINIFSTSEWKNYDYQRDIEKDLALQEVKSLGKEVKIFTSGNNFYTERSGDK